MGQGQSRSRTIEDDSVDRSGLDRSGGGRGEGQTRSSVQDHASIHNKQWTLATPRVFDLLAPADHVLLAGCGGGYDILSGLPLYFSLRAQGKRVTLANLSFTDLPSTNAKKFCRGCYAVSSSLKPPREGTYFPELYLTQWLKEKHADESEVVMYAFERDLGVNPLSNAYCKLVQQFSIDAIVLVDGGTDSVMFGSEEKMGTPAEDHCSMAAVNATTVPVKILSCLGFGVDSFHGVSHGLFLENVTTLEQAGGYLGSFSVSRSTREGQLYMEGYKAVAAHMQPSIVCSSIVAAMEGHFGDHHSTDRTKGSELFINPLMSMYWMFDLTKVMDQIPYARQLASTENRTDVLKVIYTHNGEVAESGHIRRSLPLPM